ncbi:uncharacterized protein LOC100889128 [Strongylocentrotus purpuratus]|uniref:3CxxC-type domain-containing protein n=1 Tax=Strongylocentrotus purpuratus TaxID=7668 RepID=A0A7M7HHZ0_STRPU|nr:uncharacterized protein LOC100889128 [Strongylocentrotus purpuratus]|eukprot:XP_011678495.1 PREDICTED: uncharacterized protein LOC100889128 [Strongylocentrotus purpuratus]
MRLERSDHCCCDLSNTRAGYCFVYKKYFYNTLIKLIMDYSEIIRDEMEDEGIMPSEIPERSARQGVRGFADMKCCNPSCRRTWSTHKGHVVIDLKRQNVNRIWKQKCKKCDRENEPTFRDLVFRELVIKAIEQERKYRNPDFAGRNIDDDGNDGGRRGPPHESSLCEKCEYGRTKCWIRK